MTTADADYRDYFVWVVATIICWAGTLIADLGFTDTAVANGAPGLLYWIPSLAVGAFGISRRPTARSRWLGGLLTMVVPAFVATRWLAQIL